jgi:hypothetical protein
MAEGGRAGIDPTMKTPPASEGTGGVFHAFTSGKVAALEQKIQWLTVRSGHTENF